MVTLRCKKIHHPMTWAGLLVVGLGIVGMVMMGGCKANASGPEQPQAWQDTPVEAEAETVAIDSTTKRVFTAVMDRAKAEAWHLRPMGEIVQAVGESFLGTPYVAGLLDTAEEETLVLDLGRFDCVLFIENVLALARGIAVQDYRYETYAAHVLALRYRDGKLDGYASRLHYFSEWIADNQTRGLMHNMSRELGGEGLGTRLRFMSEHRQSYPRLATNDSLYQRIQEMEQGLVSLSIHYIPQNRIRSVYDRLQPGDIIATATDIPGLDVSHSGLVYVKEGKVGYLHASTSEGVKVSPDLQGYVENNKKQVGIVVARPLDPRAAVNTTISQ